MSRREGMVTPGRRRTLVPHERCAARWILRRQQNHRTPAIEKMQANYGPEGIELLAIAAITGFGAALVVLAGMALLFVSGGQGTLGVAAYVVMGMGASGEFLPSVRSIQAAKAGKEWRNGRPFQR
jgi:hypothetical protein